MTGILFRELIWVLMQEIQWHISPILKIVDPPLGNDFVRGNVVKHFLIHKVCGEDAYVYGC